MAEKGFGVKEINLIGPSGTPTITSPNNLNLNANNVAISTNVSIGGTLSVTGNVSVGGTLTYEDVTNIDSIGIITARSVIHAGAGLTVTGITTFRSDVNFSDYYGANGAPKITFDDSSDLLWFKKQTAGGSSSKIWLGGGGSYDNLQLQQTYTSGGQSEITTRYSHLFLSTNDAGKNIILQSSNDILLTNSSFPGIKVLENGVTNGAALSVEMYWGSTNTPGSTGGKKFETTNAGVVVTGICTATSFSGSGANLTNLPAATPTNSDIQVVYTVTANGSSAYRFAGNGVVSTADNPDLYLIRGQKYRFINNSGGSHPFQIRESSGGSAYSTGVTNNGAASGNIDFAPTFDSPAQLVYQCTSHGSMVGNIYLRDAAGGNTNVGVTTFANITVNNINGTPNINVGTGEADIYSTGSGDQLSLRLLNSDASAGNKIGIYFGPANNVAGAYIKGVAESDFTSAANRDAGLEFGTRFNANFLAPLKISANGIVTKPSYHPAFRAGRSSDVNPGANGTIVFNYVSNPTHFNQGGHYSNSTGAFTAPVAGIYNFYTQVLWENVPNGENMADAIMLYYNSSGGASGGVLVSYDARRAEYIQNETGNAGYYGAHTTLLLYMAANSSIYVRNLKNLTVHGNANFTFFQGYLVG